MSVGPEDICVDRNPISLHTMTCPTVRGVQWAVLCAYARTLPLSHERRSARARAAQVQPPGELGRALVLADELGFLNHAHLTPVGHGLITAGRIFEGVPRPPQPAASVNLYG